MSKTYEYIPTLSITPDTQEHRMSAARFIPSILGRRKLIAHEHKELFLNQELCTDPNRRLTTAQRQAGLTLEQVDAGVDAQRDLPLMKAAHRICRSFTLGRDGATIAALYVVYVQMLKALSSANSVENDIDFKSRAHICLDVPGEARFKVDLSPLKFESDGHHLHRVADTLRVNSVTSLTAYGHIRSDAEQAVWDERSLRANTSSEAIAKFRTGYVTNLDAYAVTDASEQGILKALSKKSETAEKITQGSWSKRIPENMSNVIVSLAPKTADKPFLKVQILKKRRVDDFDNTIGKSFRFSDVPDFNTAVTGPLSDAPVGFRIYNKDVDRGSLPDGRTIRLV